MATRTKKKMAKAGQTGEAHVDVPMSFQSPESSSIDGAEYNESSQTLRVLFRKGPPYTYSGVPRAVWAGFVTATSKGAYFTSTIRPLYAGVREEVRKLG